MAADLARLRDELAPCGVLRVALNDANFLLVQREGAAAQARGVAPDLGRAIAARLALMPEFVHYLDAGLMSDAVAGGAWDIGFMGAEPARAERIAFTDAYVEIEAGYLVPPGSPLHAVADVDREGIQIAVAARSAYDLFLSRTLQHAELVRAENIPASYELFLARRLHALAGLKPRLIQDARRLPGSRLLDGRFTAVQQAIGTPSDRILAAAFLKRFVEEAKASGLVAELIARYGVEGITVPDASEPGP